MSEEHFTAAEQAQFDAMRAADDIEQPAEQPAGQPAASPSPAPPAEPAAAEGEQPAQPPKMVQLAALHEERERRKQYERDLAAEREQRRVLEERTNLLLQRFNQQQPAAETAKPADPPEPTIPDLATDPVGHIIGNQQALARQLAAMSSATREQQEQFRRENEMRQVATAVATRAQAMEEKFATEHQDYAAAVQHLTQTRHREMEIAGFRDPVQRHQMIQQEGFQLAAHMIQNGGNPAEAIYELAKMRGYAPAAPAQPSASTEPPAPQEAQDQAPSAAQQKLETIAAGQQQARSLGQAGGSGPTPLTVQRLIALSDKEFGKMLETSAEARALLGA